MRIRARWNVRGGICTDVVAEHRAPGWMPAPLVALPEARHESAAG
jgi:7-cyano-7-deazaguanine reductase